MVARIPCLALALGVVVGCYNIPQPECGFACGPAGACPSDYSCNSAVNRCQLDGTAPSCTAAPVMDAGVDTVRDSQDDFIRPTVIAMVPARGEANVSLTTLVVATFSEPVFGVSSSTMVLYRDGTPVSASVDADPGTTMATLQPFSPLEPGAVYSVGLVDSITDAAGNALDINTLWDFTTPADLTDPIVTSQLPAAGAVNVGVGASILANFSERVFGVSGASFAVTQNGTPVPGTVSYTITPSRATFTQSTQLAPNTVYTVNAGAPITDASFNSLTPATWTFTTGADLQAPIVIIRTPPAASTGVAVTTDVTATFDETVTNVSGTTFTLTPQGGSPVAASVSYVAGTRSARLTPALQLAANTPHTATLTSGITDGSGNPLSAVSWAFTTGSDATGPRVAQTTPADLATGVTTSSTIVVRFDEPVQNVNGATCNVNGGAITGTLALSAGTTIATFTPDAALPASSTISVNLTTAITDAASNALAAPITFSFTTGP